jgi:hypothetical protein
MDKRLELVQQDDIDGIRYFLRVDGRRHSKYFKDYADALLEYMKYQRQLSKGKLPKLTVLISNDQGE